MGGVDFVRSQTEIWEMEDANVSDSELVHHIKEALSSVSHGDTDRYNQLVGVLHHTKYLTLDEVALLVTSLKALNGAISYIDATLHESLIVAIFEMSLWNYGAYVMDAIVELVISLAALNGKFVDFCLDMLVRNFVPPHSFIDTLKQPRGLERKDQVLSRVHSALKDIADLVPLVPLRLEFIICQRMPSVFVKEPLMVIYVENMLRLEGGAMGEFVGRKILMALVDKLIDLDVEIGWDDILSDNFGKGIFEMEFEDADGSEDEFPMDGYEFPAELNRKSLQGNLIADKLDSLMALTFEHLESCEVSGRVTEVFDTLLQSFQKTILTTYKSKFAQFVLFYACALDPDDCGIRFAMKLVDIFFCSINPPQTRMSAVAYLASYLSRGKFLSTSVVTGILKRLVDWCLEYCKTHNGDVTPENHKVFYSGCQAIMYVLCFRMRSMIDVPRFKSELLHMPIGQVLTHRLSPLKVCLPSVVDEFLRQTKAAHIFTSSETLICSELLESELSKAFGGTERLDMFFPFDPCLLRRSDKFIRPYYISWSMVRPTYDDNDEECSGRTDDDEEENETGPSFGDYEIDLDEFDLAINKMSITPKTSLINRCEVRKPMPSIIRPSTNPESL